MKKPSHKKYCNFVKKKKKELEETHLIKVFKWVSREQLLYGRLIIEIYNKFFIKKWEETE